MMEFKKLIGHLNLSANDLRDLSIAALAAKHLSSDGPLDLREQLIKLLGLAGTLNLADQPLAQVINGRVAKK